MLGKQRKESAKSGGPQRAERAGASESLGKGEEAFGVPGKFIGCWVFDVPRFMEKRTEQQAAAPPEIPLPGVGLGTRGIFPLHFGQNTLWNRVIPDARLGAKGNSYVKSKKISFGGWDERNVCADGL